jgi:hypothetical protein
MLITRRSLVNSNLYPCCRTKPEASDFLTGMCWQLNAWNSKIKYPEFIFAVINYI